MLLIENFHILEDSQRVFNTDETFFLSPKGGLILASKGESVFNVAASSDKENVTMLLTINAAGEIEPPITIIKYRRLPQEVAKSAPSRWGTGIGWGSLKTKS